MPEFDFGTLDKSKKKPKIIPITEAIENVQKFAKKQQNAIKKRNQQEYKRLERTHKKVEIDSNKVYKKLREMDETKFPIFDIIIRRAKSGRKHSYLESYINFINRYANELLRDD